jgi:hypothetical protein
VCEKCDLTIADLVNCISEAIEKYTAIHGHVTNDQVVLASIALIDVALADESEGNASCLKQNRSAVADVFIDLATQGINPLESFSGHSRESDPALN